PLAGREPKPHYAISVTRDEMSPCTPPVLWPRGGHAARSIVSRPLKSLPPHATTHQRIEKSTICDLPHSRIGTARPNKADRRRMGGGVSALAPEGGRDEQSLVVSIRWNGGNVVQARARGLGLPRTQPMAARPQPLLPGEREAKVRDRRPSSPDVAFSAPGNRRNRRSGRAPDVGGIR